MARKYDIELTNEEKKKMSKIIEEVYHEIVEETQFKEDFYYKHNVNGTNFEEKLKQKLAVDSAYFWHEEESEFSRGWCCVDSTNVYQLVINGKTTNVFVEQASTLSDECHEDFTEYDKPYVVEKKTKTYTVTKEVWEAL